MTRSPVAVVIIHDGKGSWYRPSQLHVKLLTPAQAQALENGNVDPVVHGAALGRISVRNILPTDLLDSADVECG
jgi:hypothetical protein